MRSLIILLVLSVFGTLAAQEKVVLFPNGAPGEKIALTEKDDYSGPEVGGMPVLRKTNVSVPEIVVYPVENAAGKSPAMVVCPGGGYGILAYDMEGTEVCSWLNSIGVTAVLLKYRVPRREGLPKHAAPLQDVQRALSYIRFHADEWEINSEQIGVMGFSAGAHLSVMASTSFEHRTYEAVDEADSVCCRPDFCLLVYPAYLSGENFSLSQEVKVTEKVPPTMMVQAEDDHWFIDSSLFYYYALKQKKVPAWLHVYSSGGHGYGIRNTGHQVNEWPQRAADWFRELHLIP